MVWDVKRKVWALRSFGRRHLRLGDSMAPILAVTKGRSPTRLVLRVCRQRGSLALASFSCHTWRWVPSEHNAGDPGSRGQRFAMPAASARATSSRIPASSTLTIPPPPGLEWPGVAGGSDGGLTGDAQVACGGP
eukprot:3035101-Pyramimonas_sp.AAC.1